MAGTERNGQASFGDSVHCMFRPPVIITYWYWILPVQDTAYWYLHDPHVHRAEPVRRLGVQMERLRRLHTPETFHQGIPASSYASWPLVMGTVQMQTSWA